MLASYWKEVTHISYASINPGTHVLNTFACPVPIEKLSKIPKNLVNDHYGNTLALCSLIESP